MVKQKQKIATVLYLADTERSSLELLNALRVARFNVIVAQNYVHAIHVGQITAPEIVLIDGIDLTEEVDASVRNFFEVLIFDPILSFASVFIITPSRIGKNPAQNLLVRRYATENRKLHLLSYADSVFTLVNQLKVTYQTTPYLSYYFDSSSYPKIEIELVGVLSKVTKSGFAIGAPIKIAKGAVVKVNSAKFYENGLSISVFRRTEEGNTDNEISIIGVSPASAELLSKSQISRIGTPQVQG